MNPEDLVFSVIVLAFCSLLMPYLLLDLLGVISHISNKVMYPVDAKYIRKLRNMVWMRETMQWLHRGDE